jgi:hypothetical protein
LVSVLLGGEQYKKLVIDKFGVEAGCGVFGPELK